MQSSNTSSGSPKAMGAVPEYREVPEGDTLPSAAKAKLCRCHLSFPDVPEALSEGETRAEALDEAADALIAALGGYIHEGREIPSPSAPGPDQPTIVLPSLTAAQVALYRTMRQAGLTPRTLARRLGMAEQATRRMIDLDSRSRIETIEEALSVLGKRLVVEIRDAA